MKAQEYGEAGSMPPDRDVSLRRQVSYQGDAKKLRRNLGRNGWRVEKRKEYWLLFPPDGSTAPARMPGTPSSQRTWSNLLADLKQKGYKP